MHEKILNDNREFLDSVDNLIELVSQMDTIDQELYHQYNVKRGLRNADGTGVLVGLTAIGEVHGYVIEDSDKIPTEGKLLYRGINLKELIEGNRNHSRFGFEEICFLILFFQIENITHAQCISLIQVVIFTKFTFADIKFFG